MKRFLQPIIFGFFFLFFFAGSALSAQAVECSWSTKTEGGKEYPTVCIGGFQSEAELRQHSATIACTGSNCGSVATTALESIFGSPQGISFSSATNIAASNGTYSTCYTAYAFDSSVTQVVNRCINPRVAERVAGCVYSVGTLNGFQVLLTPGLSGVAACADGASTGINQAIDGCSPTIKFSVKNASGQEVTSCEQDYSFIPGNIITDNENDGVLPEFSLCEQAASAKDKNTCNTCLGKGGIWTAFGCVRNGSDGNPTGIVQDILRIGLGLSGGFVLLTILYGAFMLSTSSGNPKRVQEAQEMITSAVMGLFFIIFSIVILRFIGVSILRIPGFGS